LAPPALLLPLAAPVAAVLEALRLAALAADEAAQGLHRWPLEERGHRNLGVQLRLDPRHDLDGEQRMAAEAEEVVLDPYLADTQQLRPDSCDLLLGGVAGRDVAVLEVRARVARRLLLL